MPDPRTEIVAACQLLEETGLTHGTSGNISMRAGDQMLITPSATPYGALTPDMIVAMPLGTGIAAGGLKPSVEWPFHRAILMARPDVGAIVHTHSRFATILSLQRRPIPPLHYMIAAFGGGDIRCADYALFGSDALSENAVAALDRRRGCLLANHGAITLGDTLPKAMALARELEELACQAVHAQMMGDAVPLSDDEIAAALDGFASYGQASTA